LKMGQLINMKIIQFENVLFWLKLQFSYS